MARTLGTGIDHGNMQEAANGDTYLLHSVQQNSATGQHTTRWLNIGPREGLSDTIEGLRSISGVKDDTPLGIASRSMMDIYRRMGVGDTPTFTVAPENFKQLSFAGDAPGGIYSRGTKTIYLHGTGSPIDRLKTAVHEGAHAIIIDVALAGAVDGRLLAVQVRVQAQLCQRQHACSNSQSHVSTS